MDMVITTVKAAASEQPAQPGAPFACTVEITLEVAGLSLVNTADPEAVKAAVSEVAARLLGMQIKVGDSVLLGV